MSASLKSFIEEKKAREQKERAEEYARRERAFISKPYDWLRWPLLPMKRHRTHADGHGFDLDVGLLFAGDQAECRWVIYRGLNIFDTAASGAGTWRDYFAKASSVEEFESVEAMQAAGWRVD